MFGNEELEKLRLRKELLVLECDTRRLQLISEWQRLRSPDFWLDEAGQAARRHPWLTTALGVGAGVVALQALRRPGKVLGWLGRFGGAISTVRALRKFFTRAS